LSLGFGYATAVGTELVGLSSSELSLSCFLRVHAGFADKPCKRDVDYNTSVGYL